MGSDADANSPSMVDSQVAICTLSGAMMQVLLRYSARVPKEPTFHHDTHRRTCQWLNPIHVLCVVNTYILFCLKLDSDMSHQIVLA